MAKIDDSETNVEKGLQEYEDIAKNNNNYGTVLSGARDAMLSWETADSAIEEGQKNKEKIRSSVADSFDPIISHDWFAPGYWEDRDNVSNQYAEIEKKKKALRNKRKAAGKAAREKADEEYNKIKDEIYNRASERMIQARDQAEEERLDSIAEKVNKAKTWSRANWLMSKMGKRNSELKKEVTADILDLNKDERKELNDALKVKLAAEKKALDEYDELADTKEENEKLNVMKKAYWKARNDLSRKQAPYAIRNAFLIIDMVQKSLQNIGRALPQTKYSPAYTKTPMEEPNLFKLWRGQIEKGQERQQDLDKAVTETLEQNIKEKYAVPEGASKIILENQMKWGDKFKDQKLSVKEKEIATDLAMELEKKFADYYDDETIKQLALAETMRRAGKVDAMDTYYNVFVHKNIRNIEEAIKSLTIGGQAKNALVGVLEAIEKSTALKASTLGIANDILRALAAGLKEGIPSFDNTEQGIRDASAWLYKISGGRPDDAISIINHCSTISPHVLQKHSEELTKINEKASKAKSAYESIQAELDANEEKADLKRKEMEAYEKTHPNYKNDWAYKKMVRELDKLISVDTKKGLEDKRDRIKKDYDILMVDFETKAKALENLMLPNALKTNNKTK